MSKRITIEEAQQRLDDRFPDEDLTILEWYSMDHPIKMQCNQCGAIFTHTTGYSYFRRVRTCGCAHCGSTAAKRHQEIEQAIMTSYDILEKYDKFTNGKKRQYYKVQCKQCGHIREIKFSSFLQAPNCGCQEGGRYAYRTAEEFVQEINNKCPEGKYELLSKWVDTKTKVRLRHSCGFIWDVRPSALLKNKVAFCPRCGKIESQGARYVSFILDELGIDYVKEKALENSKCRFDFFFEYQQKQYAIEYNGKQHYVYTPHFTPAVEDWEALRARDNFKKQYCLERGISFLEIPYTMTKTEIKGIIHHFIGSTTMDMSSSSNANCHPSSQKEEDIV